MKNNFLNSSMILPELLLQMILTETLSRYLNENNLMLEEKGFGYLIFKDNQLKYWSDRSISFYDQ